MALVVGVLAALGCGVAALGVPAVLGRLPGQPGDVGRRPGLRWRAVLLSAVAGGSIGAAIGVGPTLLFLLPLVPLGVALGLVDAHTHLLPTRLVWPGLAVTAVLAAVAALVGADAAAYQRAVVAALVVWAVFHALWWVHPDGMGYGDVRLSTLLGFALGYLGWAEVVLGVYGAFVVFALASVARAVVRRDRGVLREALPFGPFLLVGSLAAVVAGGLG